MAFRELSVVEIREILRRWQRGEALRAIADNLGADRKTVRRYVRAAQCLGLARGGPGVDDEIVAGVVAAISPGAPPQVGAMREHCRANRGLIAGWVAEGCLAPKIRTLLQRHTGVRVPRRTLCRFLGEELGANGVKATVRVADPPLGQVIEADFMDLGRWTLGGKTTKVYALVCVAACSRDMFVWPCLSMKREMLIEGLEQAWLYFGGVFPVVVFDNPKAIVLRADPLAPRMSDAMLEYSQSRGFVFDLARVRRPQDKPRVERAVRYVRSGAFAGERFVDLDHMRSYAVHWCQEVAGVRIHGTTRRQPRPAFLEDEQSLLLPLPSGRYDPATWHDLKVGRDHAVTVAGALYSVPHTLRGERLRVRVDGTLVRMLHRGAIVKVHPRVPAGEQQIDPADLPPGTAELATRDAESLRGQARRRGSHVGDYAERLLQGPAPWTRMRHVYRLLGLCRAHGDSAVHRACGAALELDVVDVQRIARMLERGLATTPQPPAPPKGQVLSLRFGRDPTEFEVTRKKGNPDAT